MRNLLICCGVVVFTLVAAFGAQGQGPAANQQAGPAITAPPSASILVGRSFNFPLTASGGTAPYSWHLAGGRLPPGLKLHPHRGTVSGVPTAAGEYRFTVAVADSGAPQLQAQRAVTISVIAGLTIEWKQYPSVQGDTLSGSVVVTNQAEQDLDLTVVVVAVNSIGRATTLGYQHVSLAGGQPSPVVAFSSSPGLGAYVVHADAIAHHPGSQFTYRTHKQTSSRLQITQH